MIYAPTFWILAKTLLLLPLIETIVFQCIIIEVARGFEVKAGWQLVASLVTFAGVHFVGGGVTHSLLAGAVGGYYLAFTYLMFRDRSVACAVGMTFAFHGLHNLLTALERTIRYG